MKENRIHTMLRTGIVLVFALILGLSSFFADRKVSIYAGVPENATGEAEIRMEDVTETIPDMEDAEEGTEKDSDTEKTEESTEKDSNTEETEETTETDSDTQETEEPEYIAPDVKITIEPQEGWHKKEAVVYVSAEDMLMTGNFSIESVKVKISQNGSWTDITDDMSFVVSENCSVYVMVTDKKGTTYEKNRYITCFDKTKPVLNAAVNGGLLSVQAQDSDSGVKAVYVNGYEFTELTNGVLNIRLQEFDTGYEYFTVQAMDLAGNMSDVYRVKNIYYKTEADDKEKSSLPEDAKPTEPTDAKVDVTEHDDGSKKEFYTIQTDSEKVFYLIIDKSGENEQVYFLTEISERDLLNVTSDTKLTLPQNSAVTESAIPDDTKDKTDEEEIPQKDEKREEESSTEAAPVIEPDVTEKKEGNSLVVYIIMGIAAAAGIGAGYYFKVYKKKQEVDDDEELYEEESYENENEDWDNFEVEDIAEDTEENVDE